MRLAGVTYRYPGRNGFTLGPLDVEGPNDRPWLVLGPSGSGKSTLLRILGGALSPQRGEILGRDRDGSAYLPQLPERALAGRNLAEDLTGRIRPPTAQRRRLRELLGEYGLAGVPLSRRSRTLSAGERRRLALALIRLSGYENWALDEPDAALDAAGHRDLVELLSRRGPATPNRLWIGTHRFELYGRLEPWVVVLDLGKIVTCGDLGRVLVSEAGSLLSVAQRPAGTVWNELGWGPLNTSQTSRRKTFVQRQLLERLGL